MALCLEMVSHHFYCYYPNPSTYDIFISVHSEYFHNCTEDEDEDMIDPPENILVTLILVPVSLIPILVYMVVRNSRVED